MALPDGRVLAARLLPAPEATDVPALARSHGLEWEGQSVLLDAQAAGVDASLGGRLWVDVPHPGDVMCPLGMHGQSKKLSDLMGEAHVPVAERAAQPVVHTSPTGSVVWVAGLRRGRAHALHPGNQTAARIKNPARLADRCPAGAVS